MLNMIELLKYDRVKGMIEMIRGRIIPILVFVIIIAAAFAGCGDESAEVEGALLKMKMPGEDFIVTDMAYSQEKGLQISGFTESESHKITASAWNYGKDKEWEKGFEKAFSCEDGKEMEAQMFWSSDCGFVVPYTWKEGSAVSPKLEEEFYYVNPEGNVKKQHASGLSGINNLIFTSRGKAYWTDFTDFSLKRCDFLKEATPEEIKLSGVRKVSRIAYSGNYLYILGFEGDAALYDVKKEKELPCSETLLMLSKELFDTELAGNEFTFAPYIDENRKEVLYYIDHTGLWKYENGEKARLLDGEAEGFAENTYFTDMVVKDENTIFIKLFKSNDGLIEQEILQYSV